MTNNPNIALMDMDGTLCDYDGAMQRDLAKLASPNEEYEITGYGQQHPDYIWERMKLIKSRGEWWENLPQLKLGFDILNILKKLNFQISILTQGPKENPIAWSHKVSWCMKNVPDLDITITRDKGLVYGKVLVDDYPEYIERWLKWRPRGFVIMPAQKWNENFVNDKVLRYNGENLNEVQNLLEKIKDRKSGEKIENR